MTRLAVAVVVALGALGAGAFTLVSLPGARPAALPTYRVARASFVRRVTAEGNLRAVKSTPLVAPRGGGGFGPMKIAWLAPDGVPVTKGQVVVRFDPTEPEKQLRDGQADLASANARLGEEAIKSRAAVDGRATDAALAADELAEQRKLQARDPMIFSRNQIIESEIDEQLGHKKQAHATSAQRIEGARARSNAAVIAVERSKAELAIAHASAALDRMAIVAPHDGILVLQRDWRGALPKLSDSLWPGQAVAEIPLLDAMEAEVFVLEIDGSGLAERQAAALVIEARPERVFPGKIRLVDKLAQPRQPGSPVRYFAVVIELATTDRAVMKPGQRVRAELVLDREDALVVPRQAVVIRDGKPIVYRRAGDGFAPVAVELGAASAGRVVVKAGLAPGDEIALRDPTRPLDGSGSAGPGVAQAAP